MDVGKFSEKYKKFIGEITLPGTDWSFEVTEDKIKLTASKYLLAVKEAGKIYRHIETKKGSDEFIIELSMDESDYSQSPIEIFFILAAIADENIPVVAFAPKFSGHFNKGVDYEGDVFIFEREFEQDVSVIVLAVKEFNLPQNLKLSVHSGSDKYSIYGCINKAIKKHNVGLHLKTAGTTWLEEITGLVLAGEEGIEIVREIYSIAFDRIDELSTPYREVIDINRNLLPPPEVVNKWSSEEFALALKHDISVIALAVKEFNLPQNLKLSVHSGSDKYSIYGCINKLIKKHNVGLHLKTAGTTWLEEIIGLALAGEEGLRVIRDIYEIAYSRVDELSAPYKAVVDIDRNQLPQPDEVNKLSTDEFTIALKHDIPCEKYNPNLRQLFHISYKIAAEMGRRFTHALEKFEDVISERVTENIYNHVKQVFG